MDKKLQNKGSYNFALAAGAPVRTGQVPHLYVSEPIDWQQSRIFDSVGEGDPPGRCPDHVDAWLVATRRGNLAFRGM